MTNIGPRQRARRAGQLARLATAAIAGLLVTACAAPGTQPTPTPAATATAAAPSEGTGPSASAVAALTCGTAPVVLNAYFETGFDLPFKL